MQPATLAARSRNEKPLPNFSSQTSLKSPIAITKKIASASVHKTRANAVIQKLQMRWRYLSCRHAFLINFLAVFSIKCIVIFISNAWAGRGVRIRFFGSSLHWGGCRQVQFESRTLPSAALWSKSGFLTINRRRSLCTAPCSIKALIARDTVSLLVLAMIAISCCFGIFCIHPMFPKLL